MGSIPIANPSPPAHFHFPRRGITVLLLLGAIAATMALATVFAWPTADGWVMLGSADELAVNQPVAVRERDLYLVRLESGEVLALLRRSPHLGCTIVWRQEFVFAGKKGWFRDPCSGSNFTISGDRMSGPAPRGMDRYAVHLLDGRVFVDIGSVLCGPPVPAGSRPC